jgi:hypothetical protein
MPTVRIDHNGLNGWLTYGGDYKPGDMPPTGYLDWHEWAEVQHKAGLKQKTCSMCSNWYFPQELLDTSGHHYALRSNGEQVLLTIYLCKGCKEKHDVPWPPVPKPVELPKKSAKRKRKT